ncbi:response regulator transcription factor [Buchananella hordeovulneris]|uniref:DNA-binding response regulator n=1 Tax=Buchananella hordeovulneris TaxID=52770 RepID=A0A1Q5PWF6_9ACTO|nr:response regulator transcription factor [Buchananella hordeovulneris]MDO5080507.1 response regulator transcription factor [Buchananella hordeovulneris]OKL51931.1 DNA-binding response regulator [Buchananella hordeovulneris]RRD44614.1 DNA-binding response regulator [Buchananella hordeovulneris]
MTGQVAVKRLLLVDDDTAITAALQPILQRAGFVVSVAGDGQAALDMWEQVMPDVVVTDVLMPRLDGRELVRRIRSRGRWTPVVLLTQVGESFERSAALDEGADDYLNKPFDPQELISRIRAVLRRSMGGVPPLSAAPRLVSGLLVLDRLARRVTLAGREVQLTPKASLLLDHLMAHPGEVHSRERLLSTVWGFAVATPSRAVDHRIRELRRALGDDAGEPRYIETVQSMGYRFRGEVVAA